jgi:tagaturonate epimerase
MTDVSVRPRAGAVWLGVVRHPSTGIRLPELFLPGILSALKRRNAAGTVSLSFGRETAPESVIHAPPGQWEITRGHTGTSIREYMTTAATAAEQAGVSVEVEADHLILIGSQASALRRLAGDHAYTRVSHEQLQRSLEYYRLCIDEAAATGVAACFTIDASDLYWEPAMTLTAPQVRRAFAERFAPEPAAALLSRYLKPFRQSAPGGMPVSVTISPTQAMRLALRFQDSLEASAQVYDCCRQRLGHEQFSWEIALDETAATTTPRESLFYLTEWRARGLPCHYLGPHIGFAKRVDYDGNLAQLELRVRQHHAIARGVAGALLSIHSGDGATPYSGKGEGVYEAISRGTGGAVKFKISDVYYELLLELMGSLPQGSAGYQLYLRTFDAVEEYLREQVRVQGPLVTPLLLRQFADYERDVAQGPAARRHPRTQFFRFNAFLSLNMRDADGSRPLREALLRYVRGDASFRDKLDREVEALTLRMVDGLGLADNLAEAAAATGA